MLINSAALESLRVGFKTLYSGGLSLAKPMWERVATRTDSTHSEEKMGWLGEVPEMREWIGGRHIHSIKEHDYAIKNVTYELTIGVDRDRIKDDNLGTYAFRFRNMGKQTGQKYDRLVWSLLKGGFSTPCYDGQYFFDTDHPVIGADGAVASVANTDGGAGEPWFLIDTSQVMLPIILQVREPWTFVSKDDPKDERVFMNKEFLYGVDGRCAAGYGFWQMAWGSKQALDAARYKTARAAMMSMKGDHGVQLGIQPNLLVVTPNNEEAGKKLLASQLVNGGECNPWAGSAELLVVPWLA